MNKSELQKIMPHCPSAKIDLFLQPLIDTMAEFGIDTPKRQAAFLAQLAHESGEFRYVEEIASGKAYEGRKDLGNVQVGDGIKFKGRGLIQITGRSNYEKCGKTLGLDLLAHPELLSLTVNACRSAGWFWKKNNLNKWADLGDMVTLTKRINGGTNGLQDRLAYYKIATEILK